MALGMMLTLATLVAAAAPASATLRVELKGGLLVQDKTGNSDTVTLSLVTAIDGVDWIVSAPGCGSACFEFSPGCTPVFAGAACDRLNELVSVNLLGGNDSFSVTEGDLPIIEPLAINLGTGSDSAVGSPAGNDTIQGGSGNDNLGGLGGDDTIDGSVGDDVLRGDAGNDTLLGDDGSDHITPGLGTDNANAGAGADTILLATPATPSRDEKDDVNGGIGFDRASYVGRSAPVRIIEANLETLGGEKDSGENDVLRSIESYSGTNNADIITGVLSSNASNYFGEGGNDQIFGSSGNNTVTGGGGADELDGNEGNDLLDGKTGEGKNAVKDPVIDCGTGSNDRAVIDSLDDLSPSGCENLDRSPAGEGPHVRLNLRRVVAVAGGRVSVELSCPRKGRRRCAGTLELRLGKARTARTRYALAPGRSRRASILLGALRGRVGRRTVGQLISLERSRVKPGNSKITLRRIVLAR